MKKASEHKIEVLLAAHPYLIQPKFSKASVKTQLARNGDRLDLMIEYRGTFTVVEIKKVSLKIDAITQLERYLENWGESHLLAKQHYLVGKSTDAKDFAQAIRESRFKIKPLFLGSDIPLELAFDSARNQYVPFDSGDVHLATSAIRILL